MERIIITVFASAIMLCLTVYAKPSIVTDCPNLTQCLVNPCDSNPCRKDQVCIADYCHGGCDYKCQDCKNLRCLLNASQYTICPLGTNVTSYCNGCYAQCLPYFT